MNLAHVEPHDLPTYLILIVLAVLATLAALGYFRVRR